MIDDSPVISPPDDPIPAPAPAGAPYYDMVTRWTAAAAHVNPWLCRSILNNFFARPHCAWGPAIGVDPAGVLRHAVEAQRRRRIRDATLILILAGSVATVLGRLSVRHGLRPTMITFLVLGALVVLCRLLRKPLRWLATQGWSGLRKKPRRMIAAGIWAAFLTLIAVTTMIRWPGLLIDLAVLAGAVVASWATLIVSAYLSLRRAAAVRDAKGRTAEMARPLSDHLEDRLAELNTENVVVYGEGRADLPFLGSGQRIKSWKLEIDRKLGAPGPAGGRLDPLPFTDVDLNHYLDSSFVFDQSATTTAVHRLYIDGRRKRLVDSAVRDSHPLQSVPYVGLLDQIARPDDGSYRRVYFCLERVARQGEIVVSVFVRPRIDDHLLYIELAMHALFPLDPIIVSQVARLSNHRLDRLQAALKRGTRRRGAALQRGRGRRLDRRLAAEPAAEDAPGLPGEAPDRHLRLHPDPGTDRHHDPDLERRSGEGGHGRLRQQQRLQQPGEPAAGLLAEDTRQKLGRLSGWRTRRSVRGCR
jgi:hypothetical protein